MMRAVGIYIYAGGFTSGVAKHFDVRAHLEEGPFGVATSKLNHDLEDGVHEDPMTWPELRDIDFAFSNPPCAPWSNAGKIIDGKRGAAYAGDSRLACVERSFDAAMNMRARVWAWESVARTPQLARPYIEALAKRAAKRGHACTVVTLNAVQCGAPQLRQRAFVLMHDVALDLALPELNVRTVRDAWAGEQPRAMPRPPVSLRTAKWLARVPQGGKLNKCYDAVFNTTGKLNVAGRPGFLQRRLAWDRPSFTITGGCHLYHPMEDRYISVYESSALCGFPRDYDFVGGTSSQYAQVGKGVMPPVAEWLAGRVKQGIMMERRVAPGQVRYVDLTKNADLPGPMRLEEAMA